MWPAELVTATERRCNLVVEAASRDFVHTCYEYEQDEPLSQPAEWGILSSDPRRLPNGLTAGRYVHSEIIVCPGKRNYFARMDFFVHHLLFMHQLVEQ